MVAINQIAFPATVVLGLVSQALALPISATQDIVESGLLERAIEAEIDERAIDDVDVDLIEREELFDREVEELSERDIAEIVERYIEDSDIEVRDIEGELEERNFFKKIGGAFKKVAKVGASVLLRDVDGELSERDVDDFEELFARALEEEDLSIRDIDERSFFKKIGGAFKKVAKVGASVLLRDVDGELVERSVDDLDERDFEDIFTRALEEEDLSIRDIEERNFFKKIGGAFKKVAKVGASVLLRDVDGELVERSIDDLTERDFEDIFTRALEEDDLSIRDIDERSFFKKIGGAFKKVAKVGASVLLRDVEGELSERDVEDFEELFARALEEELNPRDIDGENIFTRAFEDEMSIGERSFFKKIGGAFKKVAKVGASVLLRDVDFDERDIEEEIYARYYDDGELDLE